MSSLFFICLFVRFISSLTLRNLCRFSNSKYSKRRCYFHTEFWKSIVAITLNSLTSVIISNKSWLRFKSLLTVFFPSNMLSGKKKSRIYSFSCFVAQYTASLFCVLIAIMFVVYFLQSFLFLIKRDRDRILYLRLEKYAILLNFRTTDS